MRPQESFKRIDSTDILDIVSCDIIAGFNIGEACFVSF